MNLPQQLTPTNFMIATDGGTVFLMCADEGGNEHTVKLVQQMNPRRNESPDWIPGRLYFDSSLVALRSDVEAGILGLLCASLTAGTDELQRSFTARVVDFVASDLYLRFAERVKQVASEVCDPTQYTVWIACDAENRNQVIVRLARVEGIGINAARERIDHPQPLAENISASEVPEAAAKYLAAGLTVRVEPTFPWPLS